MRKSVAHENRRENNDITRLITYHTIKREKFRKENRIYTRNRDKR